MNRIPWPEYFMRVAYVIASRSTCTRRQVGAVMVKDKRILATGYNGSISGVAHCDDVGCLREKLQIPSGQRHELCRAVHAEQNAVAQASKHGLSLAGAECFTTLAPCAICAKLMAQAGVARITYAEGYPDTLGLELLAEAGIPCEPLDLGRHNHA